LKQSIDTRRIVLFLLFAFGIAWAVALIIYLRGGLAGSRVLMPGTGITEAVVILAFGYMWAPALANLLTRAVTREGWGDTQLRPKGREHWLAWGLAWFLPAILTLLGIYLYFIVFPAHYDASLATLQSLIDFAEQQSGQSVPLGVWTVLLIQIGEGILLAPILNSFFTFGEEFGWRAYLQPKLMPLGFRKAVLLTGLVWGLWHAPIIAMGHNYGFGYPGAPWSGILAMTWFTVSAGVIFGWLVLRGGSVWPAVLAHASINGLGSTGLYLIKPDVQFNPLLGPLPVGVIGGLPWLILAIYLLWKGDPRKPADVSRETSGGHPEESGDPSSQR